MLSQPSRHDLERKDLGDVTVVRFTASRLEDEGHVRSLFQHVLGFADEGRHNLVLNFQNVEYMASVAIGKLIMLHRKVQAANGRLVLCNLSPASDEVLEVMHLKGVIPTYDGEEEALLSF